MKILLSFLSFRNYSGSELYFYELATAFIKLGYTIDFFVLVKGPPLINKIKNVKFVNKYTLRFKKYDAVLFSHGTKTWKYIHKIKTKKFINIIHSEVIDSEKPILDSKITNYIAIRPSIINYIRKYTNNAKNIKLIFNPFDLQRFNSKNCIKNSSLPLTVLFIGDIDYLRKKPIEYLIKEFACKNYNIIHVGKSFYNIKHQNFYSYDPKWEVEDFFSKCDISAGIFLGRSTIEGLLCGKKALQFDVTKNGNIKKIYWHQEDNLDKFDRINVAKEFIKLI